MSKLIKKKYNEFLRNKYFQKKKVKLNLKNANGSKKRKHPLKDSF
jgi:hypothetical protein